jgi:hypothetical protein
MGSMIAAISNLLSILPAGSPVGLMHVQDHNLFFHNNAFG